MATIYGDHSDGFDVKIHEKNATLWNAWVCKGLSQDEKHAVKKVDQRLEILDWVEELQRKAEQVFAKRLPDSTVPHHTKYIDFKDTYFEHGVRFAGFLFPNWTEFERAHFTEGADFSKAYFIGAVFFTEAHFTKQAHFDDAQFKDEAFFSLVRFTQAANFFDTQFTQVADFRWAQFTQSAGFSSSRFEAHSYFQNTIFGETANYTNASFAQPVNFRGATFIKHFPDLEGTDLHGKITLTVKANHWPKVAEYSDDHDDLEKAASSCAHLRHNMTAQGLPDDAHFFFRCEMDLRLKLNQGLKKLPHWFFGVLSEYGYSYTRPLGWLIQLWLVWTLVYTPYFLSKAGVETLATKTTALAKAAGLSFANIFAFFGFNSRFDTNWTKESYWLIAFTGLETILGFILLFFLGLGLRNQFRLK